MEEEYFNDRIDAGRRLAGKLKDYAKKEIILFALPRGGVVVGFEIAKLFHQPLNLLIPRKIGHPQNPEYAVAAITEDGQVVGDRERISSLDQNWLTDEVKRQKEEIKRRRKLYDANERIESLKNKIAIIIDDGIATGLTVLAAVRQVKNLEPEKIIVAVPVCPPDIGLGLEKEVDELICVIKPELFLGAISGYYESFPQVTDDEVILLLQSLK